jgi:hypothetical protein
MSNRKPHSINTGYVAERKVQHAIGGHVVIYDRNKGFDCDADERWIVMHEPTGTHLAVRNRVMAYDLMKSATVDPEYVFGEGTFNTEPQPTCDTATAQPLAELEALRDTVEQLTSYQKAAQMTINALRQDAANRRSSAVHVQNQYSAAQVELEALRARVAELEADLSATRRVVNLYFKPDLTGEYRFINEAITHKGGVLYNPDDLTNFDEGVIITSLLNNFGYMDFDDMEPLLNAIVAAKKPPTT